MKKAFTLIEILIVVSILGILSAIVFPEFQAHAQQSREAAAKDTLRIARNAIELYASRNNDIPPGYPGNDTEAPLVEIEFRLDMLVQSRYLSGDIINPFNGLYTMKMIANGDDLPAAATGEYGWIYKAETKDIRLDWPDTDSEGNLYYDY